MWKSAALATAVSFNLVSVAVAANPAPLPVENIEKTAASYGEAVGGAERIESAALLRTYSQEVAAAACFYYNGVDPELSRELMIEARTGFDLHLAALMDGNDDLGIFGPEERKKTIVRLDEIEKLWSGVAMAVDALMARNDDTDAVAVIKGGNMPLFDKTDVLVSEMEGQYSNPAELLQVDVLMMEIVGRQSMMTQKIAKNACKIWSGNASDDIKALLSQSVSIYEASLNALLHGMPEVGIKPAPTPEIAAGLEAIFADWTKMRPTIDKLVAGEDLSREALIEMFRHMVDEMHQLEEITHAYVVFSKHEY